MSGRTFLDMVAIPAGAVTLSDRRTRRTWTVEVQPHELGTAQITEAVYAAVTGSRPSSGTGNGVPVVNVSSWEAVRFCNILSERSDLPSGVPLCGGCD